MNALRDAGQPLFFRVGNPDALGLEPPADHLGEAIRTHVRSLSGMQKEALLVSRGTGTVWRLASDEGAYLNGDDEAPCPLAFLTTGMVCSYMEEIRALAKVRRIEIANLRLVQDNYYTMQGSALKGTMTGGAKDVALEVQIDTPADRESVAGLLRDATAASPVAGLLGRRNTSLFSLMHNGRALECGRVEPIDTTGVRTISDAVFEAAEPASGNWSEQIVRGGLTPRTDEATSHAGSSLAEHQERTLHVRGICTLRADGVKRVEQQLFNPHGSIFHFLSDEAPDNGGRGHAPDARAYLSAGIAFCFMTQLGRYATIARKNLRDYRIAQDTHFSTDRAAHGANAGGRADPVETHVELTSGEDDEFARSALDMSEQTCFLHALCRTPLETKVRIRPFDETAA